jgi:hypothetical protein
MSEHSMAINKWCVKPHARFVLTWLIGWCCLGFGCVPSKVQTQASSQFNPSGISSVAVLPFQTIQTPQWKNGPSRGGIRDPEEIRTQFRLPGTDQVDGTESKRDLYVVSETAAQRITAKVVSMLGTRALLRVIGPSETSAMAGKPSQEVQPSLKAIAQEVGTRLQVDGVLTGLVRTYRNREGSKLGAKPAAVGFEMYLVRPSDGTVLWTGEFFEEQKPLTQDVMGFFEKGGGFITAEELADLGVEKVMNEFPVGRADHSPPLPPTSLSGNP